MNTSSAADMAEQVRVLGERLADAERERDAARSWHSVAIKALTERHYFAIGKARFQDALARLHPDHLPDEVIDLVLINHSAELGSSRVDGEPSADSRDSHRSFLRSLLQAYGVWKDVDDAAALNYDPDLALDPDPTLPVLYGKPR